MPLALLLSVLLHLALIAAPAWFAARQPPPRPTPLLARLMSPEPVHPLPENAASSTHETISSEPEMPAPPPQELRGGRLRQAQQALSKHLFYPPEAIAAGLEGEVVLLLTLADDGRIVVAEIARSSGHPLLDQAALDAAGHLGRLAGNPRQMLLPVSFRLQ